MDSIGDKNLEVVVLYNKNCPATPGTIERIEKCASDSGIRVKLRKVLIDSRDEANEWKFLGSPTVRIGGLDIDPAAREAKVFGFM